MAKKPKKQKKQKKAPAKKTQPAQPAAPPYKPHLSEGELDGLWKRVQKFWGYPRISKPQVFDDPENVSVHDEATKQQLGEQFEFLNLIDFNVYVSRKNLITQLGCRTKKEEGEGVEALLSHGVGHYGLIPFEFKSFLKLQHQSAKGLMAYGMQKDMAWGNAPMMSNVFQDTILNTYIVRESNQEAVDGIKMIYDRFGVKHKAEGNVTKSWEVYMRVCERLWSEDGRFIGFLESKLSDEQEKAAEKIENLLKYDTYAAKHWDRRAFLFAQYMAPFLESDPDKNQQMSMFEQTSSGEAKGQQMRQQGKGQPGDDKNKGKGQPGDGEPGDEEGKDKQPGGGGSGDKEKKDLEKKLRGLAKKMGNKKGDPLNDRQGLQEYKELMVGTGICDNEEEADQWYYRDLASQYAIKFIPTKTLAGVGYPHSVKKWNASDPVEALDIGYSILTSGRAIPDMTTYQWEYKSEDVGIIEGEGVPDLYIWMDSSGSMINPNQQVAPAVVAAIASAQSALAAGGKVSVLNFSGDSKYMNDLSEDEELICRSLCYYQGGGTTLPTSELEEWVQETGNPQQHIIITDTGVSNFDSCLTEIKKLGSSGVEVRGALFAIGESDYEGADMVRKLKQIDWEVFRINGHKDLMDLVVGKTAEAYGAN